MSRRRRPEPRRDGGGVVVEEREPGAREGAGAAGLGLGLGLEGSLGRDASLADGPDQEEEPAARVLERRSLLGPPRGAERVVEGRVGRQGRAGEGAEGLGSPLGAPGRLEDHVDEQPRDPRLGPASLAREGGDRPRESALVLVERLRGVARLELAA